MLLVLAHRTAMSSSRLEGSAARGKEQAPSTTTFAGEASRMSDRAVAPRDRLMAAVTIRLVPALVEQRAVGSAWRLSAPGGGADHTRSLQRRRVSARGASAAAAGPASAAPRRRLAAEPEDRVVHRREAGLAAGGSRPRAAASRPQPGSRRRSAALEPRAAPRDVTSTTRAGEPLPPTVARGLGSPRGQHHVEQRCPGLTGRCGSRPTRLDAHDGR